MYIVYSSESNGIVNTAVNYFCSSMNVIKYVATGI